jgi:hypothetical protein
MPQTLLLIHDDGARATRVSDSLFDSNDGFYDVEWAEHCSEAVRRLRTDRQEHTAANSVDPFLPDSHGLEAFDPIICSSNAETLLREKERAQVTLDSVGDAGALRGSRRTRNCTGQESVQLHATCRDRSVSTGQK